MEGNLTRARSSLYITPSGSMSSIHSSSPLSRSTPSPSETDARIVPQLGVFPATHRQVHATSDSSNASPGHSRVYSENSISSTMRVAPFPARSASAAARYMERGSFESSQPSPPMRQSPETAREDTKGASGPGVSPPLVRTSPPRGVTLEPLGEDEVPEFEGDRASVRSSTDEGYLSPNGDHRLTRSASSMQMRDLRDQMQDLKGRLSVLRDRARDDTMKRRSLQSLRTPSPFTAAEQWYTGAKGYKDGGLSADAGVAHPPWREEASEGDLTAEEKIDRAGETPARRAPEYASSEVTSVYEDVTEGQHAADGNATSDVLRIPEEEEHYNTANEDEPKERENGEENEYNDEIVEREELDDYESDASLYHDTLATPISHEDREDAFDYEHFFLHSAMGTISQQRHGRRDSVGSFSSEDSVETTRGLPAPAVDGNGTKNVIERTSLGHMRSESTDSISTMATFATANEGMGSEHDDDEGHDNYAVQQIDAPPVRSSTPLTAKRSTFGSPVKNGIPNDRQPTPEETSRPSSVIHDREERNGSNFHRPSIASFDSFESTGTNRSFPLVNKPKGHQSLTPDPRSSVKDGSILSDTMTLTEGTGSGERLQPSPVHMLAKEDQILVERLVASLGKCVLGLQDAGRASYEGRVWRRRLDAARRVLEGQEGAV